MKLSDHPPEAYELLEWWLANWKTPDSLHYWGYAIAFEKSIPVHLVPWVHYWLDERVIHRTPALELNADIAQLILKMRRDPPVDKLPSNLMPPADAVEPSNPQWLGNGKVQIGNDTIALEPQFSEVLQALVEARSATIPELQKRSGRDEPDKLLKKLVIKFPALKPFIRFPGGRGKGGYSTTIAAKPK